MNYAPLTFKKDGVQFSKTRPLVGHGAAVAGKTDGNFNPISMAQSTSIYGRHDAPIFKRKLSALRHTIAGVFAAQFAAISGRNDVLEVNFQ